MENFKKKIKSKSKERKKKRNVDRIKKITRSLTEEHKPTHRFLTREEKLEMKYRNIVKEKTESIITLKKQVKVISLSDPI